MLKDLKTGSARLEDDKALRWGREYLVFYKRSELKYLVTRDQIPLGAHQNTHEKLV